MTRSEMRESVFKLVFEELLRDDGAEDIIAAAREIDDFPLNERVEKTFAGVVEHGEELDAIISKYSTKRQFGRIPKVNVALLRLALYEIIYEKLEMNIAISEAVLLATKYTYESDVSFVNGVLGAYSRSGDEH